MKFSFISFHSLVGGEFDGLLSTLPINWAEFHFFPFPKFDFEILNWNFSFDILDKNNEKISFHQSFNKKLLVLTVDGDFFLSKGSLDCFIYCRKNNYEVYRNVGQTFMPKTFAWKIELLSFRWNQSPRKNLFPQLLISVQKGGFFSIYVSTAPES